MRWRRLLGRAAIAVLLMGMGVGCKGKKGNAGADEFRKRCEQLGKACGDTDKHQETIAAECKPPADKLAEMGCTAKAMAVYDCYEKELCGKGDKVWAIDDLRVLAERHEKCVAERNAVRECVGK